MSKGGKKGKCTVSGKAMSQKGLEVQDIFIQSNPEHWVDYARLRTEEPKVHCPNGHLVYLSRIPWQSGCRDCSGVNGWPLYVLREYYSQILNMEPLPWHAACKPKFHVAQFVGKGRWLNDRQAQGEGNAEPAAQATPQPGGNAPQPPPGIGKGKGKPQAAVQAPQAPELLNLKSLDPQEKLPALLAHLHQEHDGDSLEDLSKLQDEILVWLPKVIQGKEAQMARHAQLVEDGKMMTAEIVQLNDFQSGLVELAEKLQKESEKKKEAQEEKILSCMESQQIDLDKVDWDQLKLLWEKKKAAQSQGSSASAAAPPAAPAAAPGDLLSSVTTGDVSESNAKEAKTEST